MVSVESDYLSRDLNRTSPVSLGLAALSNPSETYSTPARRLMSLCRGVLAPFARVLGRGYKSRVLLLTRKPAAELSMKPLGYSTLVPSRNTPSFEPAGSGSPARVHWNFLRYTKTSFNLLINSTGNSVPDLGLYTVSLGLTTDADRFISPLS
ncbi:hypothetical protein J6590_003417 [Homalodisca vitripennis]|nr:hypothetical protein J6590_003417 [Homalodisca vitripennis]